MPPTLFTEDSWSFSDAIIDLFPERPLVLINRFLHSRKSVGYWFISSHVNLYGNNVADRRNMLASSVLSCSSGYISRSHCDCDSSLEKNVPDFRSSDSYLFYFLTLVNSIQLSYTFVIRNLNTTLII